MPDAEDGRVGKPFLNQLHQQFLTVLVERRRGFVHDDDVGLVDEQPGEGDALLLAAGERLVPRRFLLDPVLQLISPTASSAPLTSSSVTSSAAFG